MKNKLFELNNETLNKIKELAARDSISLAAISNDDRLFFSYLKKLQEEELRKGKLETDQLSLF